MQATPHYFQIFVNLFELHPLNLTVVSSSLLDHPICLYSFIYFTIILSIPNVPAQISILFSTRVSIPWAMRVFAAIRTPSLSHNNASVLSSYSHPPPPPPALVSANQNGNLDKRKSFPRQIACAASVYQHKIADGLRVYGPWGGRIWASGRAQLNNPSNETKRNAALLIKKHQ